MIANFLVKTKQQVFPVGTVGGVWQWTLVNSADRTDIVVWNTRDPIASHMIEEGTSYIIQCVRLDDNNGIMGQDASTQFTAKVVEPPVGESITVADTMTVALQ